MGLFDIIAESKILDWQKTKTSSNSIERRPKQTLKLGMKQEDYLLESIKDILLSAFKEADEQKRIELQKKSHNLEVQLISSYEKQGFHLLAKMKQDQIIEFKRTLLKL